MNKMNQVQPLVRSTKKIRGMYNFRLLGKEWDKNKSFLEWIKKVNT